MAVILVADDDDLMRRLVSSTLESAGHEVMKAGNGFEAVSLYRSYPDKIDLVITDMQMPVLDGHQVVKLIREVRPAVKIVCMSGYTETWPPGVKQLPKPFLPAALRQSVEEALAEP